MIHFHFHLYPFPRDYQLCSIRVLKSIHTCHPRAFRVEDMLN